MDENEFVLSYASNLASYFNDVFKNPQIFIKHLLEGTKYMVTNQSSEVNINKFFEYFTPQCGGLTEDTIYRRFLDFYTNDFDKVKNIVTTDPIVPKIFKKVLQRKFKIVIATNPIFPEIATRKRLMWAGLENFLDNLLLITHGEQFNTSKPHKDYYKQILEIINTKANQCLMVGNDVYNDGSASLIGMKYYQVFTKAKNQGADFLSKEASKYIDIKKITINGKGRLRDFYNLL